MSGGVNTYDENFVYPILDWKEKTGQAIGVSIGSMIILSVVHLLICLFNKLKIMMYKACEDKNDEPELEEASSDQPVFVRRTPSP